MDIAELQESEGDIHCLFLLNYYDVKYINTLPAL